MNSRSAAAGRVGERVGCCSQSDLGHGGRGAGAFPAAVGTAPVLVVSPRVTAGVSMLVTFIDEQWVSV